MRKDDVFDLAKVGGATSATLGVVTMSQVEDFLKILLLALTILYTIYKFYITHKNQKPED